MPSSILDDHEITEDVTMDEPTERSAAAPSDRLEKMMNNNALPYRDDDESTIKKTADNLNDIQEESTDEFTVRPAKQKSDNDSEKSTTFEPEHCLATGTKRNTKQYEYIKHGSRIKTLLSVALRAVADGFTANSQNGGDKKRECDEEEEQENKKARGMREMHAEDLARDRAEECVNLKRKIQDLQSQIQALQQENYASHQTSTQLQSKIDRTVAALQIASTSSANARAEADAAEAKADSLSRQVEQFHSVVEELRRGMEAVRGEHDEVSSAARSVESRLIQVESELGRATKVKIEAEEERDGLKARAEDAEQKARVLSEQGRRRGMLKARAEDAEQKARVLSEQVEDYEHEIQCLKKDVVEMEELEKIRSERTNRVENELHLARGTLLEATLAAAEAESTVTSLNSVIEELRKENELLHSQIHESRDSVNKERAKQNEALTAAEKEVHKWKLKCEEEQETNRSLNIDKTTAEKQLEQMKNMFDTPNPAASSAVTPMTSGMGLINSFGTKCGTVDSEPRKELTYISKLPTRELSKTSQYDDASRELSYKPSSSKYFTTEKENYSNSSSSSCSNSLSHEMPSFTKRKAPKSNKCCICQQDAMGMMKNC
ncbi:hypothetical protein ACHAWO_008578 [Cyclotella atomus]|uniref:Uncharacterized protein n=1 Tax=Cyclotella atomus TaxID=382360 RepID=A0ABD3PKY8_9STRA